MGYYAVQTSVDGKHAIRINGVGRTKQFESLEIVYPTVEQRDQVFDDLDETKLDDLMVRHGRPPALVETFIEFKSCAFDARDVFAVRRREAWILDTTDTCPILELNFRSAHANQRLDVEFDSVEERNTAYARVVAAMKASRDNG